jgi:hypothetical protein
MSAHPAATALSVGLLLCAPGSAAPVISEIMYRPGTGYPEETALEYIEIHNPEAAAVNVGGWALRSGVNYTFPAGTTIAPGGYLVVAANPGALQSVFGSVSAIGPWPADNSLSNNGERIRLSMPGATAGDWETVDEVTYASEGDWAHRVRESTYGGWDWTTPASSGGKSLELRNPALSNDNGQNWAASTASNGGTPGAQNTVQTDNLPPIIKAVKHAPPVPTSTQSVKISCEVNDEALPAERTATLFWRNATTTSPPTFSSVPMTNDGTGKLTAVLPPSSDRTIIEFYISSTDGNASRTWPAPTSEGQNANCQLQFDNEPLSSTADTYRLTLTAAENNSFNNVNSSSDRQFNQTLIVVRGTESSIHYRGAMRIRGNSSRGYQFKPLRVSLPNDDPLDGVTRFNLNPRSSFLQYLGMRCFQAAGLPAPDVIPVELRRNGVEDTTNGGGTPDFGLWVRMEELGGEMVDNHWPEANSGNIYKKGRPDEFWRSTASPPSTPDGLLDGWSKQNNSSANDWSDLTTFFQTWQTAAAPHFPGAPVGDVYAGSWNGVPFDGDEMEMLDNVSDTLQWARWFAMMTLLQSNETNISNGQDDDYACYFVPALGGRRRMQLLPHDLDTIFGMGDSPLSPTDRGLYDATEQGSAFRTLQPLLGTSSNPGNADFRTRYHNAIREMCGTVFSSASFPQFVDYHLGAWAPAGTRTGISSFMSARCTHLLGLIGSGPLSPPPPSAGFFQNKTHGPLIISEILAANATAYAHDGGYPDLIELQNTGAVEINLRGKSLTDDPAVPQKFTFPADLMLPPGAMLLLIADSNFSGTGLHIGFGLDQSGDALYLYESTAGGGAVLDSIVFGPQATDFSIGRTGANLNTLTICTPTPGAPNTLVTPLGQPGGLRINEWLTNPDFRLDDDFIEIHNPGTLPVPMGGMRLTDDFINYPQKHILPVLSFIGPGGFHVFKAKGNDATPDNPSELPFALDSTFGGAALLGTNGSIADRVDTVSQFRDQSTGRTPDGSAAFADFAVPSPGLPNDPLPGALQALLDSLRITEFIYKPNGGNDYEFIEMTNTGATPLQLGGVRFTSGVNYTFPEGTALAPGAFLVVCRNRTAFLNRFPNAASVLAPGQYGGALDNSGETLTLSLPNPRDIAILNFRYDTDWEPLTFNAGYSLTHVDASGLAARDYNERESWTVSSVPDGTPGSDGPPGITSPLAASVIAGNPFTYTITASRGPTLFGAAPLPAGLTVNTVTGVISGTPSVSGSYPISISATNPAGTDTRTLVLTVASSGPLHHFTWDHSPSLARKDTPFPVSISARDLQNRIVTSFNGTVPLTSTAVDGGNSTSSVYITEVTDESDDQFELQNTGSSTVDTTGWYVAVNGSSAINSVNTVTWTLPDSVAPGELLRVSEYDNQPGRAYFGGGISWTVALNRGWIMLFDAGGTMRDFMAWGWSAEEIEGLTVTVRGAAVTVGSQWSGAGAPVGTRMNNNNAWQRTGTGDTNAAADWRFASDGASWSVTNTGLELPWVTMATVPVSPAAAVFTGGVFAGFLTIDQVAGGVRITAADAQSHTGASGAFDVVAPEPDTDGDRMPDAWESANGMSPSVNDAVADADGDGFNNLTEYHAGTDPRSAGSALRITEWSASPPAVASVTWEAQPNRLYRIQYSTGLSEWSHVPGQVYSQSSAGPRTATFVPPQGTGFRASYRVQLLLPP